MGLKLSHSSSFFQDFQRRAALSKVGRKRPAQSLVMKQLHKDGKLIKTPEALARIGEQVSERIKKNGHPKGMLGKHHSTSMKVGASIRSRNMWADPKSKFNSTENRQRLSDLAVERFKAGTFGRSNYSRGRMGTYDINGKKMFFRSLWEVNYALYLDFLVKQKQIKKWEYEVDTFWFEDIKRGVRSYKPDFKVFNNNGTVYYDEIKGYMDAKSKTKIKRMAKYYPEVVLNVIEQKEYQTLKRKLGKILKFYQ